MVWLLILGIYVFAGMMLVPFHPDETAHIHMSRDYATLFLEGNVSALSDQINPETGYFRDPQARLRILDAPLHRYTMGLAWTLAGQSADNLPGLWEWNEDYATNTAEGRRPTDAFLSASRAASTLFLFLSIVVVFAFGWQIDGRWTAYLVSLLYTLNPVLLLHARRAMHEAPLLFFGLLTLLIAALIAQRIERDQRVTPLWWGGLLLSAGLALAAKHSGIFFIAAAFAWVLFAEILKPLRTGDQPGMLRRLALGSVRFVLFGLGAVAILIILNPGMWSNPPDMLQRLLAERTREMSNQIASTPDALLTLPARIPPIITFPFVHRDNSNFEPGENERYYTSLLIGLPLNNLLGWTFVILTGAGIVLSVLRVIRPRDFASRTFYAGLLIAFAVQLIGLLTNPLPWQRYYLALIPLYTLFIGVTAHAVWTLIRARVLASQAGE